MRKQGMWRQLFAAYLWLPIIVLTTIGWFGSDIVRQLYTEHMRADLEARARLCGKQFEELLRHDRVSQIAPLCKELDLATNTRITVVSPSGRVLGDSESVLSDLGDHGRRPEIREALLGRVGRSVRYSSTEQEDCIYVAVPLLDGERVTAVVRTSLPLTALTRALNAVRDRMVVIIAIGIGLHALVTLVISHRMSRPLEEIKAGAERFAAGDLNYRLRLTNSVEMDIVVETMNRMAEQLGERIQTVLHQQNEREAMLAGMAEGILAVDNKGTILRLNKACAAMLGEEAAKLEGRSIYEAIRKADLLKFIEAALAGSTPIDDELLIRGAQDRWVSAHGTVLRDAQQGKLGTLIVLHDFTRLRHLEEVRRDFVANVSHELRTPITSIQGFIETLVDGALDDRENAERFLRIMLRQVNRLDAIIRDLLLLSRIERGAEGPWIELASDSIRETLQAAVEMCEKKADEKSIRIELTCPEDLTAEINAALLEQAVVNLVDNAVKYSRSGGVVEVSASVGETEIVICVKDYGCGIEARHLPRLFERFYRVDKARSREQGGTGLGLAIVRHIALAHCGSIDVESTVGVGSTFRLRLPKPAAQSPSS